jgi:AcrR family transcriptional regulator
MPVSSISPDDTRARVLDVAMVLIGKQGFAATSTREVCEHMGFTKAALYYHFRTKDDLLSALIAPVIADVHDLVHGSTLSSSAASRRAVLIGYVDVVSRHVELIRVLSDDPSVRHRPALAPFDELQAGLDRLLSGVATPDLTARTRVRAALGGVRAALLRADADDDATVVRNAVIAAGCGALGIPTPRIR